MSSRIVFCLTETQARVLRLMYLHGPVSDDSPVFPRLRQKGLIWEDDCLWRLTDAGLSVATLLDGLAHPTGNVLDIPTDRDAGTAAA